MSWAKRAKKVLKEGQNATVKPRGHSMEPKVKDGATVLLEPIFDPSKIKVGDVVLVKVRGRDYLHLVKARRGSTRFLIGNNKGHTNGWVGGHALYGRAIEIDNG